MIIGIICGGCSMGNTEMRHHEKDTVYIVYGLGSYKSQGNMELLRLSDYIKQNFPKYDIENIRWNEKVIATNGKLVIGYSLGAKNALSLSKQLRCFSIYLDPVIPFSRREIKKDNAKTYISSRQIFISSKNIGDTVILDTNHFKLPHEAKKYIYEDIRKLD